MDIDNEEINICMSLLFGHLCDISSFVYYISFANNKQVNSPCMANTTSWGLTPCLKLLAQLVTDLQVIGSNPTTSVGSSLFHFTSSLLEITTNVHKEAIKLNLFLAS